MFLGGSGVAALTDPRGDDALLIGRTGADTFSGGAGRPKRTGAALAMTQRPAGRRTYETSH
jgi:hypothetical protein